MVIIITPEAATAPTAAVVEIIQQTVNSTLNYALHVIFRLRRVSKYTYDWVLGLRRKA